MLGLNVSIIWRFQCIDLLYYINELILVAGHEYTWLNMRFINSLYKESSSTVHNNIEIKVCFGACFAHRVS